MIRIMRFVFVAVLMALFAVLPLDASAMPLYTDTRLVGANIGLTGDSIRPLDEDSLSCGTGDKLQWQRMDTSQVVAHDVRQYLTDTSIPYFDWMLDEHCIYTVMVLDEDIDGVTGLYMGQANRLEDAIRAMAVGHWERSQS